MAKNDHVVQILRKPDNTGRPKEMVDNGRQSIGASTAGPNTLAPLTGLTEEEILLLFPSILSMSPQDVTFRKAVQDWYYNDADIDVPAVVGVKFHVSLQDNSKPLSANNLPKNIEEYALYRKAIADKEVAPSIDVLYDSPEYRFYVHDAGKEFNKEVDLAEARDEAIQAFFKIKGKPELYDPLLRLYGFDPIKDYDNDMQKERDLRKIAEGLLKVAAPAGIKEKTAAFDLFIERVGDPLIKVKSLIQELTDKKIIRKAGNSYIFGTVTMGKDLQEAAEWWGSDEASADVATMMGKLDSIDKKTD